MFSLNIWNGVKQNKYFQCFVNEMKMYLLEIILYKDIYFEY